MHIATPQINLLLECRLRIARHLSGPLRQGQDGRRWIGRPCREQHLPKTTQRRVHRFPLPAVFSELSPALARHTVIFSTATARGNFPARFDVTKPLEQLRPLRNSEFAFSIESWLFKGLQIH